MKLWCEMFCIVTLFVVAFIAVVACKCINWGSIKMMCMTKNTKEGFCCPAAFEQYLTSYYPDTFKNTKTAIEEYSKITGDDFDSYYMGETFDGYTKRADKLLKERGIKKV